MRFLCLLLTFFCLCTSTAHADDKLNMQHFKNIPVAHEGRLQPLDSLARSTLKKLSGKTSINGFSAIEWLAQTIFDPQAASDTPVIAIHDKTLIAKLELPAHQNIFSYKDLQAGLQKTAAEIEPLLQKDDQKRTKHENALLNLHENAALLSGLMRSFTAFLPLDIALPKIYQDKIEGDVNYVQLTKIEKELEGSVQNLVAQKGHNPEAYLPEELTIAKAAFHIQAVRKGGQGNNILRVIPVHWETQNSQWQAPWSILLGGQGSPESAFLISQWTETAKAYRNKDADLWATVSAELLKETLAQSENQISLKRFQAERFYVGAHLYLAIILFYALALVAVFARNDEGNKWPVILGGIGIALHIAAINLRIYILDRPPVGTLYESVLFVSLICAGAGLRIGLSRKSPLTIATGLVAAIALLLSSALFQPASGGLDVLVAVLNTNFWLTTHVLIITAGYGLCILAACLAHTALYLKAYKDKAETTLKLQQSTYHISLAALLFMAVGTILGGIWADQSWGRFWGWDPKENGALLIVLWLIWAQHGRHASKLNPNAFLAVIAALNIIVALSWFGVNLLSVGLHSYGFASGLAGGLFTFCLLQLFAIIWLFTAAKRKAANV